MPDSIRPAALAPLPKLAMALAAAAALWSTAQSTSASASAPAEPVGPAPAASDTLRLGLAECLARAATSSPRLAAAAAGSEEAAAVAAEAGARRQPLLGAGGSYQYTSEHMKRELSLGGGLPSGTLEFGDGHVADLNLGLSIPVYTGGELARGAAAAGSGLSAAQARQAAAALELDMGVRIAFSGALGRRAQVDASRLAVARLSRHLGNVEGARAAGAATEESQVRAEARLLAARQRLASAEAALDSAALSLGRLVGSAGRAVLPQGSLDESLLPRPAGTLAPVTGRADLAALDHEAERQRELAAAARGRLRPHVVADVRAHYARPGVDALSNEWMGFGTVGLSVDWPLWDSGARSDRARQAEARAVLVEAQRRDLAEAVTTAISAARASLDAAVTVESQAARRVELQRRLLAMVEGRQAQAAASVTEYLDAQDDLAQAETDQALAQTRVRLAEAALLWALGL